MEYVFRVFRLQKSARNPLETLEMSNVPNDPPLDRSQLNAIKLALTKRVAIIQGPPGTGKTFVGVLIAKLLIANQNNRAKKPLLFICDSNHALDQILEHVHRFEKNIIRVGGMSESVTMQSLNINNERRTATHLPRRETEQYQAINRMQYCLTALRLAVSQRGVCSCQRC